MIDRAHLEAERAKHYNSPVFVNDQCHKCWTPFQSAPWPCLLSQALDLALLAEESQYALNEAKAMFTVEQKFRIREQERAEDYRKALEAVDDIRNRIIGSQAVDWSRDIYPLVAALNKAGLRGLPYEEAVEHVKREFEAGRNQRPTLAYRVLPFTHDRWAALEETRETCLCSPGDECSCAYDCDCRERFEHVFWDAGAAIEEGWRNTGKALEETR